MKQTYDQDYLHFDYFLTLEEDVIRCSRYIHFAKKNYNCFSSEIAKIILAASSECDTILKLICRDYGENRVRSIHGYHKVINDHIPNFKKTKIFIPKYGINFTPWNQWNNQKPPRWWTQYNKIKHARDSYFIEANIKNMLLSVSALLICVLWKFYSIENRPPYIKLYYEPKLFHFESFHPTVLKDDWEPVILPDIYK